MLSRLILAIVLTTVVSGACGPARIDAPQPVTPTSCTQSRSYWQCGAADSLDQESQLIFRADGTAEYSQRSVGDQGVTTRTLMHGRFVQTERGINVELSSGLAVRESPWATGPALPRTVGPRKLPLNYDPDLRAFIEDEDIPYLTRPGYQVQRERCAIVSTERCEDMPRLNRQVVMDFRGYWCCK
jgi:hypothetical protein